jgi:hypothetical protein
MEAIPIFGGSVEEKKDDQGTVPGKVVDDFVTTRAGRVVKDGTPGERVYDRGESVVAKMNRERAVFDKDLFFQDLYENFLICVQRHEARQKPGSGIIVRWNTGDSFDDFLSDALANVDRQIESIKFAKAVGAQKMIALEGDFFLSEAKLAPGSEAVSKKFSSEDHDALYEILRKAKETILEYRTGKIQMIINTKTGRVRVAKGTN